MNQQLEMVKGFGVSAVGFLAWGISHAELDRWIGTGAALGGFLLVWLTIFQRLRHWKRTSGEEERP